MNAKGTRNGPRRVTGRSDEFMWATHKGQLQSHLAAAALQSQRVFFCRARLHVQYCSFCPNALSR